MENLIANTLETLLSCCLYLTSTHSEHFVFRVVKNGSPDSPDGSDNKRMRRQSQSKTFKVEISYATKIPVQAIVDALRGQESDHFQEALRVLDIILRQHAAKQYVKSFVYFDCLNVPVYPDCFLLFQGLSTCSPVFLPWQSKELHWYWRWCSRLSRFSFKLPSHSRGTVPKHW